MRSQKITVSVIGGSRIDSNVDQLAEKIGEIVARVECVLVCGGLGGVMEASCRGAKKAGGLTIGLLPGLDKSDANPFVDIALPTSFGFARNAMVAASADMLIALPGSHGTSSEISYGLVYKRPIFDLGGWHRDGMILVDDLEDLEKKLREWVKVLRKGPAVHA